MALTRSSNYGNWSRTALSCPTIRPSLIIQASGPSSRRFPVSKPRKSPLLEPSPEQGQPVLIAGMRNLPLGTSFVSHLQESSPRGMLARERRLYCLRLLRGSRRRSPHQYRFRRSRTTANKKKLRPAEQYHGPKTKTPAPAASKAATGGSRDAGRPSRGGASESSSRCWRSQFSSCGLQLRDGENATRTCCPGGGTPPPGSRGTFVCHDNSRGRHDLSERRLHWSGARCIQSKCRPRQS